MQYPPSLASSCLKEKIIYIIFKNNFEKKNNMLHKIDFKNITCITGKNSDA